MPEPSISADPLRLESRLTTIETKLNDDYQRVRLATVETESRAAATSLARLDERLRSLPSEREMSDILQRLARLETRVAHLPSKGFIITVITTIGALVAVLASFARLRTVLGL